MQLLHRDSFFSSCCQQYSSLIPELLKTYQGPGKAQTAWPGTEAAGEVLRRCGEQLEVTGGVGDATVL